MKNLKLSSGQIVPVLGQGTAGMAEDRSKRQEEIEALQLGLDLGLSLIDTAELYANGKAEELVAEAIGDRRKEAFLVSKVLPYNASKKGTLEACENTLERLKTDYLDLYLLHWPGSIPLEETLEAFQLLKKNGKILSYGVSNFDLQGMKNAVSLSGGNDIVTNQVLYNLSRRGIEWDLLPWCQEHHLPIMAYSPIEQGRLIRDSTLKKIAAKLSATPAQIALAWVLQQKEVMAIPKAGNVNHVRENHAALTLDLSELDLNELDHAFLPPRKKTSLEMI